jgi:hypothetical protein
MNVQYVAQVLRIDAPEWYRRADFLDFLNGRRPIQGGKPPATWHTPGAEPDEYSDVFITIDCHDMGCEGSDGPPDLPEDIWEEICVAARTQHITYGLVWIANVEWDDADLPVKQGK